MCTKKNVTLDTTDTYSSPGHNIFQLLNRQTSFGIIKKMRLMLEHGGSSQVCSAGFASWRGMAIGRLYGWDAKGMREKKQEENIRNGRGYGRTWGGGGIE
jgi:hypothetical protein